MRVLIHYLIIAIGTFSQVALAAETEIAESLLTKFGKDTLVPVIIERCNGNITIDNAGSFKQVYGRPNKKLVSAATIAKDMERCNISAADFAIHIRREERTAPGQEVVRATGWTNRLLPKWYRRGLSGAEVYVNAQKVTDNANFLRALLFAIGSEDLEEAERQILGAATVVVHFEMCGLAEDIIRLDVLAVAQCDNDELWVQSESFIDANRGQVWKIKSLAADLLAIRECDQKNTQVKRTGCLESLRRSDRMANARNTAQEMHKSNSISNGMLQREIVRNLSAKKS
jgi:hypothetical protein